MTSVQSPSSVTKETKDKKQEINCIGCFSIVQSDEMKLRCEQSHHLCTECTEQYLESCFSDGFEVFPPRCPLCKIELSTEIVEMNLKSEEQREVFLLKTLQSNLQLGPNDLWIFCPVCPYREIRQVNGKEDLFLIYCQNEKCMKQHCYFCLNEIKFIEKDTLVNEENSDDEYERCYEGVKDHLICQELGPLKLKIEKALEEGINRTCPQCGSKGRKDDNCTHMGCEKCHTEWCYVCGGPLENLDKKSGDSSIYGHNANWASRRNRCPMYLSQINEIDDSWPVDDDSALNHFHNILTLRNLHLTIKEVDKKTLERLLERFPQLLGGYSLQQILNFDPKVPLYPLLDDDETDEDE